MPEERVRSRMRREALAPRARRFHGDRGSIIAEAALLTPFFMTLMFGMLEFGGAFRDYLTLSNATVAGARAAAIEANDPFADWYILRAIEKAAVAFPMSEMNYVVIYHATVGSTGPPAGCKSASSAGTGTTFVNACNRFTPTELGQVGTGSAPPLSWTSSPPTDTTFWPSASRYALLAAPGPDYIGVYINITHPWITGLFGNSLTLTSNNVSQIEPQKLSS
jgi:Flp pilus assembly protein TadG